MNSKLLSLSVFFKLSFYRELFSFSVITIPIFFRFVLPSLVPSILLSLVFIFEGRGFFEDRIFPFILTLIPPVFGIVLGYFFLIKSLNESNVDSNLKLIAYSFLRACWVFFVFSVLWVFLTENLFQLHSYSWDIYAAYVNMFLSPIPYVIFSSLLIRYHKKINSPHSIGE
jgi:hypothetical protein